jgi:hypothetical protein
VIHLCAVTDLAALAALAGSASVSRSPGCDWCGDESNRVRNLQPGVRRFSPVPPAPAKVAKAAKVPGGSLLLITDSGLNLGNGAMA